MAIQLKEFQTASGRIRLQFVELLGLGSEGIEEYVWGEDFEQYIARLESMGATVTKLGKEKPFVDYSWAESELKLARKYKNAFNKMARLKKLSKKDAVEILTR